MADFAKFFIHGVDKQIAGQGRGESHAGSGRAGAYRPGVADTPVLEQ